MSHNVVGNNELLVSWDNGTLTNLFHLGYHNILAEYSFGISLYKKPYTFNPSSLKQFQASTYPGVVNIAITNYKYGIKLLIETWVDPFSKNIILNCTTENTSREESYYAYLNFKFDTKFDIPINILGTSDVVINKKGTIFECGFSMYEKSQNNHKIIISLENNLNKTVDLLHMPIDQLRASIFRYYKFWNFFVKYFNLPSEPCYSALEKYQKVRERICELLIQGNKIKLEKTA